MKIYFDPTDYRADKRAHLAEPLRPFINERSIEENIAIYGPQITGYQSVHSAREADVCILTMAWSHYFENGQRPKADKFLDSAKAAGKPVVVWQGGDFSVRSPRAGTHLFQPGGQKSTRTARQNSCPAFIRDPLKELDRDDILIREKKPLPVVGFCGQATPDAGYAVKAWLRSSLHNLRSSLRLSPFEPLAWSPLPARLRWRALSRLEQEPAIRCNFIKRRQYRAGAHSPSSRAATRSEFWQNMLESDYIVCVRGGGNFSVRLYETLAMGRIPVFINTDCILPHDQFLNWRDFCVWVEADELDSLPQRVLEFHSRMDQEGFCALQWHCRNVWREFLSYSGYFTHFPGFFEKNISCAL